VERAFVAAQDHFRVATLLMVGTSGHGIAAGVVPTAERSGGEELHLKEQEAGQDEQSQDGAAGAHVVKSKFLRPFPQVLMWHAAP
jgi:hypothetical protein